MPFPFQRIAAFAVAAALLSACGARSTGSLVPQANAIGGYSNVAMVPAAVPPGCKRQKNTATHAVAHETMTTSGGKLCIPVFAGVGGVLQYPSANPSDKVTVTSSTTNYDAMPKLHKGKPIFFLQLALAAGTTFGSNVPAGGGLTGNVFTVGKHYTAFGEAGSAYLMVKFKPCYMTATAGKYGGVIGGVGSLLKGQSAPFAVSGVVEIYPGKLAASQC